jgi:glyoxylase-like metal-dependent hydrolase (beta-lactamase superfamily II)/rhodanese-related sulfurtransferase
MIFKQFYLGCLAHASYLIGSAGEAAVVDPQRDIAQYLEEAQAHGLRIRYVIETHLHADFVSGHRELADKTGAEIVFGARAEAAFPHRAVREGEEIRIGEVILRFLETPGHTPESLSVLVIDLASSPDPVKVLTGDTLFIGDVGRPDLAGSKGYTPEQMAGMLYESLHGKLLRLADEVEVHPAHGAGSLCGRNISTETSSTIGHQRKFNYALQPMEKETFVQMMTTDLPAVPGYFPIDAEINRQGARSLDEMSKPPALTPEEVNRLHEAGAILLDLRTSAAFGQAHIPGSIHIGLNGQFASWAGSLLRLDQPILLIAGEEDEVTQAVVRLARVGIETVRGYLDGGILAWHRAGLTTVSIPQIPVDELHLWLEEGRPVILLDVRHPGEFAQGHAPTAINLPLAHLSLDAARFDPAAPTVVICAGGYRSSIATSLLARKGFRTLFNVVGGTSAWVGAALPLATDAVIPARDVA